MQRRGILTKILSSLLSCAIFATHCALAHAAETNFWKERILNSQISRHPGKPLAGIYNANKAVYFMDPGQRLTGMTNSLLQYGTIRKISRPKSSNSKIQTIIHIQDIHQNPEAQSNIGQAIQHLIDNGDISLIALEGAFGPIDLSNFRNFPNQDIVRKVADHLLEVQEISGPMHTVLSSPKEIPMVIGVDDAVHYQSNVAAYRQAAPLAQEYKKKLLDSKNRLAGRKAQVFNPTLMVFEKQVEAYQEGRMQMGEHIRLLADAVGAPAGIETFLEALRMESTLNFSQVEPERARLIAGLFKKISKSQSADLARVSMACRLGQIRHTEFYHYIQNLCAESGVNLTHYPAVATYLRYVMLCDSINSEKVFAGMREMEKAGYASLVKTPDEGALIQESRRLYLAGKILDFALTREGWEEYRKSHSSPLVGEGREGGLIIRNSLSAGTAEIPQERIKETLLSPSPYPRPQGAGNLLLQPFEVFYEEAEVRDEKMAENLLKAVIPAKAGIQVSNTSLNKVHRLDFGFRRNGGMAVLVTGGFHSPGIDQRLTDAGYTVVTFVPKITHLRQGYGGQAQDTYLSVFAQEKTPLEKLFQGDKLFLSRLQWPVTVQAKAGLEMVAMASVSKKPLKNPAQWAKRFLAPTGFTARAVFRAMGRVVFILQRGTADAALLIFHCRNDRPRGFWVFPLSVISALWHLRTQLTPQKKNERNEDTALHDKTEAEKIVRLLNESGWLLPAVREHLAKLYGDIADLNEVNVSDDVLIRELADILLPYFFSCAKQEGFETLSEYHDRLSSGVPSASMQLKKMRKEFIFGLQQGPGLPRFFREAHAWELHSFIREAITTQWASMQNGSADLSFRTLHLAGGNGQEAYSVAMILYDELKNFHEQLLRSDSTVEKDFLSWVRLWSITLESPDINLASLIKAQRGYYSKNAERGYNWNHYIDHSEVNFYEHSDRFIKMRDILRDWIKPHYFDFTNLEQRVYFLRGSYDIVMSQYTFKCLDPVVQRALLDFMAQPNAESPRHLILIHGLAEMPYAVATYYPDQSVFIPEWMDNLYTLGFPIFDATRADANFVLLSELVVLAALPLQLNKRIIRMQQEQFPNLPVIHDFVNWLLNKPEPKVVIKKPRVGAASSVTGPQICDSRETLTLPLWRWVFSWRWVAGLAVGVDPALRAKFGVSPEDNPADWARAFTGSDEFYTKWSPKLELMGLPGFALALWPILGIGWAILIGSFLMSLFHGLPQFRSRAPPRWYQQTKLQFLVRFAGSLLTNTFAFIPVFIHLLPSDSVLGGFSWFSIVEIVIGSLCLAAIFHTYWNQAMIKIEMKQFLLNTDSDDKDISHACAVQNTIGELEHRITDDPATVENLLNKLEKLIRDPSTGRFTNSQNLETVTLYLNHADRGVRFAALKVMTRALNNLWIARRIDDSVMNKLAPESGKISLEAAHFIYQLKDHEEIDQEPVESLITQFDIIQELPNLEMTDKLAVLDRYPMTPTLKIPLRETRKRNKEICTTLTDIANLLNKENDWTQITSHQIGIFIYFLNHPSNNIHQAAFQVLEGVLRNSHTASRLTVENTTALSNLLQSRAAVRRAVVNLFPKLVANAPAAFSAPCLLQLFDILLVTPRRATNGQTKADIQWRTQKLLTLVIDNFSAYRDIDTASLEKLMAQIPQTSSKAIESFLYLMATMANNTQLAPRLTGEIVAGAVQLLASAQANNYMDAEDNGSLMLTSLQHYLAEEKDEDQLADIINQLLTLHDQSEQEYYQTQEPRLQKTWRLSMNSSLEYASRFAAIAEKEYGSQLSEKLRACLHRVKQTQLAAPDQPANRKESGRRVDIPGSLSTSAVFFVMGIAGIASWAAGWQWGHLQTGWAAAVLFGLGFLYLIQAGIIWLAKPLVVWLAKRDKGRRESPKLIPQIQELEMSSSVPFMEVLDNQQHINQTFRENLSHLSVQQQRIIYYFFIWPFRVFHERPAHFTFLNKWPKTLNEMIGYPLQTLCLITALAGAACLGTTGASVGGIIGAVIQLILMRKGLKEEKKRVAAMLASFFLAAANSDAVNAEEVVEEFLASAPLQIGVGNVFEKQNAASFDILEEELAQAMSDRRFPQIFQREVERLIQNPAPKTPPDLVIRMESKKDIGKVKTLINRGRQAQSITLLVNDRISKNQVLKMWAKKKKIKIHVRGEEMFRDNVLAVSRLVENLPLALRSNVSNILLVSFEQIVLEGSEDWDTELNRLKIMILDQPNAREVWMTIKERLALDTVTKALRQA